MVRTGALLGCGAAAGPVLVLALLLQALWREDYDLGTDPISSLGLGPHGWVHVVTFVLVGGLVAALGVGTLRLDRRGRLVRVAGALLVVMAAGLVGVGVFVVDPVAWHGRLHDVSTGVAINAGLLAVLAISVAWWRDGLRGRALHGLATVVVCAALGWQTDPGTTALRHTVVVVVLGAWLTMTALWLLRDRADGH